MLEGSFDLILVRRVAIQHFVLSDQALSALGEEDFVAELDWGLHLAAFDQIGVRLKDRINFLGVGDLLSLEHAPTGLIDGLFPQSTVVVDLLAQLAMAMSVNSPCRAVRVCLSTRACVSNDLFGNRDELAVFLVLMLVTLLGGHALNLLHATPRRRVRLQKPLIPCPAPRPDGRPSE